VNPGRFEGPVKDEVTLFRLQPGGWFAMERSTLAEPDCSPVKILAIVQAGRRLLKIGFYEAFYPEGAREKSINLRIQVHNTTSLTGTDDEGRRYVFLELTREWLLAHFKHEDISQLLDSDCPGDILDSFHFTS